MSATSDAAVTITPAASIRAIAPKSGSSARTRGCIGEREHLADATRRGFEHVDAERVSGRSAVTAIGSGTSAGKSSAIRSSARVHVSTPLAVWNRTDTSSGTQPLPEHVRAREGGVTAEVDLDRRREPPQPELGARGADERGLGEVHLGGDRLHPLGVGAGASSRQTAAGLPANAVVRERVDHEQRCAHLAGAPLLDDDEDVAGADGLARAHPHLGDGPAALGR